VTLCQLELWSLPEKTGGVLIPSQGQTLSSLSLRERGRGGGRGERGT